MFDFSRDRKKEHPKAFLANSKGYLLSDAYPGYRSIAKESGNLVNVFCWAHARRMVWKAQDTDRERALVALTYIQALYKVEDEGRGKAPAKIRNLRQRKSKPILGKFKGLLVEQGLVVLPKSPIGKAIAYMLGNWTELVRFLEDGRLRIDNNIAHAASGMNRIMPPPGICRVRARRRRVVGELVPSRVGHAA